MTATQGLPISQINSIVKQVLATVHSDVNRTTKDTNIYLQQVLSYYLKYVVMKASESAELANRKTINDADIIRVLSTLDCMKDLLPDTVFDQIKKEEELEEMVE